MTSALGKKVFVGLSGGVDSSVAAALLKEAGYDVVGVFIKVWDAPWLPCDWREERRSAMRVAAKLQVPFLTLDLEKEYKEGVVDYMVNEYKNGRIPNPDVFCNKIVKFGGFFDFAIKNGADFVATGHYARVENVNGTHILKMAHDHKKEQSYFLWNIKSEVLSKILLPIGDLLKNEVRDLAEKYSLPTATKKDSQGICFLGPVSVPEFLKHYVDSKKGDVLDMSGKVIGEHEGALFYTIGQRHGFSVNKKNPDMDAMYVVSKNMEENTITVAPRTDGVAAAVSSGCYLKDINYLSSKERWQKGGDLVIRYHGERIPIANIEEVPDGYRCVFTYEVQDVAIGQSGVYYDGEDCLGGGIIDSIF